MTSNDSPLHSILNTAGRCISHWLQGNDKDNHNHNIKDRNSGRPRRPKYSLNVKSTVKYLNTDAVPGLGECRVLKVGFLGYDTSDPASYYDIHGNQDYSDTDSDYSTSSSETESVNVVASDTESDHSAYLSDQSSERVSSTDDDDDDEEGDASWSSHVETAHHRMSSSSSSPPLPYRIPSHQTKNQIIKKEKRDMDYIYDSKMLNKFLDKWIELVDFRNLRVKQISGGGYHICALTEGGKVLSIGWNRFGQLGTGDTKNRYTLTPVKWDVRPVPKIAQVKCSGRHTLLLATDGRLYTMGCGDNGRLGIGDTKCYNTPQLVRVLEGTRVKLVATTFWHNIVSTEDNRTFVFGHGEEGKLGLGDTADVHIPKELVELRGREIVSASGGAWHSIIATKDGHIYTAGSNYWGQLGISLKRPRYADPRDHSTRLTEVEALRGLLVVKASAGSNFNIVLTATNELYAFGCGSSGKCGLDNKETVRIPRKIQFYHPIKDVCNGSNHSVILTNDGHVYTFGWNKYFQLGSGTEDELFIPTRVQGLDGVEVSTIASGAFYTLCSTRQFRSKTQDTIFSTSFQLQNCFADAEIITS